MNIKGAFLNQQGYLIIRVNNKLVPLHRFIWSHCHHKKIPTNMEVHHIDGNIKNNKLSNLELITKQENLKYRDFGK